MGFLGDRHCDVRWLYGHQRHYPTILSTVLMVQRQTRTVMDDGADLHCLLSVLPVRCTGACFHA